MVKCEFVDILVFHRYSDFNSCTSFWREVLQILQQWLVRPPAFRCAESAERALLLRVGGVVLCHFFSYEFQKVSLIHFLWNNWSWISQTFCTKTSFFPLYDLLIAGRGGRRGLQSTGSLSSGHKTEVCARLRWEAETPFRSFAEVMGNLSAWLSSTLAFLVH